MKAKKFIAALLLVAICVSTLTSCQQTASTPVNPLAVETSAQSGEIDKPAETNVQSGENWTPSTSVGEKRLYGKNSTGTVRYGDMMIGQSNYCNSWGYFSINDPQNAKLICFDPLCLHLAFQEDCASVVNYYVNTEDNSWDKYPRDIYIDLYENTESPVLYFYYLRDTSYRINIEEYGYREPVYCIERYDLSKGHREVVLDNVKEMIVQACNYGHYIYYVLDMGENAGQMLYRIHKSGGEPEQLDREENAVSIKINDVVDEKLYYTVNERYIYSTNLDLTESKKVFDMADVKGDDGSQGVIVDIYCGYLYYFANVEIEYSSKEEPVYSMEKADLYRVPVGDLTQTPEKVVEEMIYSRDCYEFADSVLYYEPCVFKNTTVHGPDLTGVNLSDGRLMALNLTTGESKTIVENSGMDMYLTMAWDDMVIFSGWAYEESGKEMAGGNANYVMAFSSGEPYKIWCRGLFGALSDEYVEEFKQRQRAAREEYEASQKQG